MKLCKFATLTDPRPRVGDYHDDRVRPIGPPGAMLADLLHAAEPMRVARDWAGMGGEPLPISEVALFAPIDAQEVWGAGVTYERSKVARQEESESGGSFYDLLILRLVGPGRVAGASPRHRSPSSVPASAGSL